ncbi:nitroreductase family protein [Candidatus Micrarchaeota archaeon]|nr:nitroreductase family protein [Candidatus Micrarchaeota archaeon]MBD3417579.1 nitroreductase family protein [Candidatus Micrarchaeota archaeon]
MEVEDCILSRRSVRTYQDKAIQEEDIQKILKAGAMAPSAKGIHPARYIVITNKEKIKELSGKVKEKLKQGGGKYAERAEKEEDIIFYRAPLLILLVGDREKWTKIDCALAAENMMLQARALGLGSCYIGLMNKIGGDRETLSALGMEEEQELYCPLVFGYPAQWPHPKTREANVQKRIE